MWFAHNKDVQKKRRLQIYDRAKAWNAYNTKYQNIREKCTVNTEWFDFDELQLHMFWKYLTHSIIKYMYHMFYTFHRYMNLPTISNSFSMHSSCDQLASPCKCISAQASRPCTNEHVPVLLPVVTARFLALLQIFDNFNIYFLNSILIHSKKHTQFIVLLLFII